MSHNSPKRSHFPLLFAGALALAVPAWSVTVIENGQSRYAIAVPDGADEGERIGRAATHLQTLLARSSGVTLPIVKEGALKIGQPAIFLGATKAAGQAGITGAQMDEWAFAQRAVGANLILAGHDDDLGVSGRPELESLGTLKAVTSWLEEGVGVRYLLPGPNGTYVPKLQRVAFDDALNAQGQAHMEYITGRSPNDVYYGTANGYWGGQAAILYGGHSHKDAVSLAKYGKTHPEYFAADAKGNRLVNGKAGFTQVCLSNAAVQQLLVAEMEKQFKRGYQTVLLGQNDGQNSCKCDQCKAIHADPAERLWIVHRGIAEQMKVRHPDKTVLLLSYGLTDLPPKTFDKFPDNTAILLTRTLQADFDKWKGYANRFDVYIYNWGNFQITGYGPKREPIFLERQMERFHEANVRGIYLCGGFENLGLEGPNYYLYGKLSQNIKAPVDETLDEFYRLGYGKAYEPMKRFFQTLNKQMEDFSIYQPTPKTGLLRDTVFRDVNPLFRDNAPDQINNTKVFPSIEMTYQHFFPREVVAKMQASLEEARALESDPMVQARFDLIDREWHYVRDLLAIFDAHDVYKANPTWANFDAIEAAVKAREARIESWMGPEGKYLAPADFPSNFGGSAQGIIGGGGFLGALRNEPTRWAFDTIRKSGQLPQPGVLQITQQQVDERD